MVTATSIPNGDPYSSSDSVQVYHQCPKIKSIEYYENGTIKKVEFEEE